MSQKFSIGALKAAKMCQTHIKSTAYTYQPEEAAVDIDKVLQLPQIIALINEIVDEAKRDLANSPNWTGNTVRISKSHVKELSNIVRSLSND